MSEHIVSRPELTAEKLRELLHYDPETGVFTWTVKPANSAKAVTVAGHTGVIGYRHIRVHGKLHLAHRLAWLYVYGTWPNGNLDHINRTRSDNRIANLREADHQQNGRNMSKRLDNTSGHPGVAWSCRKSKWRARIVHNHLDFHLGYFTTLEDAVAARKAGELKYWGANRAD